MGYNEGLKQKQKIIHENTINIVIEAVKAIKEMDPDTPITRRKLLDMLRDEDTGFPLVKPATLYKPAYLKVWNPKLLDKKQKQQKQQEETYKNREITELKEENEKLKKKLAEYETRSEKMKKEIEEKNTTIRELKKERRELEDTIDKLYGLLNECDSLLRLKKLSVSEVAATFNEGFQFVSKIIKGE